MRAPSLADMMVFHEVVEARTFTAAATRLGRTKSAVSQAVSRLEADLGTRLLQRSTRVLSLTEAGQRFYSRCIEVRTAYDQAVEEARSDASQLSGTLSITAPHALSGSVVASAIAEFAQEHQEMRVRLIAEDSRLDLIGFAIDLAIRVGRPEGQAARVLRIGSLQDGLYASERYVEAKGGVPSEAEELAEWAHIANEWQGDPLVYKLAGGATLKVAPRIRANSTPDVLRLTELGLGVSRVPDLDTMQREGPRLVRVAAMSAAPLYATHNFAARAPRKVTAFIRILKRQLQTRSQ